MIHGFQGFYIPEFVDAILASLSNPKLVASIAKILSALTSKTTPCALLIGPPRCLEREPRGCKHSCPGSLADDASLLPLSIFIEVLLPLVCINPSSLGLFPVLICLLSAS